jgi:leader peptidase (prepilin peptidase)/N-methyltransferase
LPVAGFRNGLFFGVKRMFPEWTWIVGLMIGAAFGSFLNVVIYRMPRLLSLSEPKNSFCPTCKHRLLFVPDMIPLFSWLFSGGKCRYCHSKIGSRYFWVELINGSLWAALWYRYFCETPQSSEWLLGCFFMLATAALVAIIFIDGEHLIIPDEINAFLLLLGIVYHALNKSLPVAMWGWLIGWGVIFGIALLGRLVFGKDAMGHGDIKMMRGVGALLGGLLTVIDLSIAIVVGIIFGILFIWISTMREQKAEKMNANSSTQLSSVEEKSGEGAQQFSAESQVVEDEKEEEAEYEPESLKDLVLYGFSYLICLDLIAMWFPKLNEKMGYHSEDVSIEEDDWEPAATAFPFGPSLAIGALICMIFKTELTALATQYIKLISG